MAEQYRNEAGDYDEAGAEQIDPGEFYEPAVQGGPERAPDVPMVVPGETPPKGPEPDEDYDPTRGIINLGAGKGQYLQVEDRILWFRHDYPQGSIEQEHIEVNEKFALFKTVIRTGKGGVGTGFGSEDRSDFRDFIEKAATKSLGRALASLGYGTKGALAEGEVADTPYRQPDVGSQGRNSRQPRGQNANRYVDASNERSPNRQPRAIRDPGEPASEAQRKFIYALSKDCGLDAPTMQTWIEEVSNKRVSRSTDLNKGEAAALITKLQERKDART